MKTKRGKKSNVVKNKLMFIPNVWLPIEFGSNFNIDYSIRSAFCFKDRIQWFFFLKRETGFVDFEPVRCECCKGKLHRDTGFDSGFNASDTPEVLACLMEHPTKSKTLALVFTQSSLEIPKRSLQGHILKHDFTGLFKAIDILEGGSLSLTRKQGNRLSLSKRKKLFSTLSLLNSIVTKKRNVRGPDRAGMIASMVLEALEPEKRIKESEEDRLRRQKFSELAKDALKRLQSVIVLPNNLKSYKKFKENQKQLNLLAPIVSLKNASKNYEGVLKSTQKKRKFMATPILPLNAFLLPHEAKELSERIRKRKKSMKAKKASGQINKKKTDSKLRRSR